MPLPFSQPPPSHELSAAEGGSVRTIMTGIQTSSTDKEPHVVVAAPDDTLEEAYQLFKTFDLHHLPIVQRPGDKLLGVVSAGDLMRYLADCPLADRAEIPLRDIMTRDPETVLPGSSVSEAAKILANSKFHCLPVVSVEGSVLGIVTTRDLVRYLDAHFGK